MARTRTLAQIRADVLWQADREGTSLRNAPEQVDRAINQSIAEFREAVSDSGDPTFLVKQQGTLSVGATSPYHFGVLDLSALSPAHLRVYGFDINVQGYWRSLDTAMFRERNDVQVAQAGASDIPVQFFQFDRSSVAYAPASSSAYEYLLWYLPVHSDLVADGDTFDGMNGWEDWVVFNAVSRLLLRDRDAHLERFEAERARILARIIHVARQRQRAGAQVRGGVRGGRGPGRPDFFPGAGDGLNQPGSGEGGRVALARSDGKLTYYAGQDRDDRLVWSGSTWVKRRGWITPDIDLTGATDATATIAAAGAVRPGACVYIPDGIVRLSSTLTVPAGCTITSDDRGMRAGDRVFAGAVPIGARFDIRHTGVAFAMSAQECSVRNVGIYYPDQQVNATPTAYGYTFDVSGIGCEVSNVTCVNPYQFIKCAANGSRFDNLYAYPLSRGIYLGRCPDVVRVSNCHFNPITNYEHGATLIAWVQANCAAFVVDGPEAFQFTDCFAYGVAQGLRFVDSDADGFRGASGSWKGGSLDLCGACVRVDPTHGLSLTGLSISDTSFVTIEDGSCVQFLDTQTPASNIEKPGIWVTSCHGNSAGHGMARLIWMTSGSYGKCAWVNGVAYNVFNEVARGDSTHSGLVSMDRVGAASGTTRTAGTVVDTNAWTI